jgi:tRNA dimethylallyltransferase
MLTILGPTASGKTRVAAALAASYIADGQPAEIVSADSRQIYRRMDIGTGKDLTDYQVGNIQVPLHLTDTQEPGTRYDLYQYQRDATAAIADIRRRGALPILCGGTGLYIEAVLKGYALSTVPQNPELRKQLEGSTLAELTAILEELKRQNSSNMHNTTDVDSAQRAIRAIEIETFNRDHPAERRQMEACPSLVVGIDIDREERRRKISQRLDARLEQGMVEEVRALLAEGIAPDDLLYYGLEYRYVTEYVLGRTTFQQMHDQLEVAIHQFAKRQMTWFRGMQRRGTTIHWIPAEMPIEQKVENIRKMYQQFIIQSSSIHSA